MSEISSLPAQMLMENPACPSRRLPDVHVVKPKLEPLGDSPPPPAVAPDADEDQETTPLSGDHPFFTAVMSRQVQKPHQLVTPGRFHRRLPARRAAAVLRCGGRSWIMSYCGDTKLKRFDAAWADFAVDNRLQVGDACVFELVAGGAAGGGCSGGSAGEVVFRVQILRGSLPEQIAAKGATADEPIVIVE